MSTKLKPEMSARSKYHISKHRYYELKHFCLQYPEWKREYAELLYSAGRGRTVIDASRSMEAADPTSDTAVRLSALSSKIDLVERTAALSDGALADYILKGITREISYDVLLARYGIPCSRSTYYDRYRRFFWLLSNSQNLQGL